MTRVVRFHEFGGPEVLRIEDVDLPAPGAAEVQLRVKAIGLNRAEINFRQGLNLSGARLPERLGYEASGLVEAVGAGVSDVRPGDAVSVIPSLSMSRWPTYGEVATVPAELVVRRPASLSWEEAAAAWMQYVTAYGALIDIGKLGKGDRVLITAASSSVGLAAIQMANMVGALPIAATRTRAKAAALLRAGASEVIVTEAEDLTARIAEITGSAGVRLALDPIGGPDVAVLAGAMADGGVMVVYGLLSREPTPLPLFSLLTKSLSIRGFIYSEIVADPWKREAAKTFILGGLSSGDLKPIIARTFPFEEIVNAHRYLEFNEQFGKVVVTL